MEKKIIKRGDIYQVDLDPTIGKEIKKTRRCVIISNNQQNLFSPIVVVLPITSSLDKVYSWEVVFPLDGSNRKILTDQIRSVDKKRLREYKGQVNWEVLNEVESALGLVLGGRRNLFSSLSTIPTKLLKEELKQRMNK